MVRVALLGLGVGLAGLSAASSAELQKHAESRWALHYGPAQSVTILGSEDLRNGALLGLQHFQPIKLRLLEKGDTALVLEAYHLFTKGGGLYEFGPDRSFAYGVLAHSRWYSKGGRTGRFFAEFGWGLQVQNTITHDMGSRINSTPTVGLGWTGPLAGTDLQVTLRFMHMSSAGLVTRNLGQNQIQVLAGFRF